MIKNLQYLFKPLNISPGFEPGQEVCMSRYLTEYCQAKEIPYIVMQSWRGSGEDSYLEGYLLINATNKQIEFIDERSQVLEYIIETISNHLHSNAADGGDNSDTSS